MIPTKISRLETEDLLQHLQEDAEMVHTFQIETEDDLDERPIYCVWTLQICRYSYKTEALSLDLPTELCIHLDVLTPDEFDMWAVTSYWEGDSFPYSNCPLQYLATASQVVDLDWRREVIRSHRDLADTLEFAYLRETIQ